LRGVKEKKGPASEKNGIGSKKKRGQAFGRALRENRGKEQTDWNI